MTGNIFISTWDFFFKKKFAILALTVFLRYKEKISLSKNWIRSKNSLDLFEFSQSVFNKFSEDIFEKKYSSIMRTARFSGLH